MITTYSEYYLASQVSSSLYATGTTYTEHLEKMQHSEFIFLDSLQ
jgi:hypothetical protein